MKSLLVFLLSCTSYFCTAQTYEIVLSTDFDGNVTSGSKAELIKFIREGKPVRVGWQLDFNEDKEPDFDHWVEATFITILGEEVFSQIDPIYTQGPNTDIPQVQIYPNNTRWTAVIGTNSKLLNRYVLVDSNLPDIVYDEALGITKEEFQIQKEQMEERNRAMKEVATWEVATFWSVGK